MSVDTHLKGKNIAPYRRVRRGDVTLFLHPELVRFAGAANLYVGRRFIRSRLMVDLEHQHTPACRH